MFSDGGINDCIHTLDCSDEYWFVCSSRPLKVCGFFLKKKNAALTTLTLNSKFMNGCLMIKQFKSFPKKDSLMCWLIPRLFFLQNQQTKLPPPHPTTHKKILKSSVTDCDDFFSTRQNNIWSKISKTLELHLETRKTASNQLIGWDVLHSCPSQFSFV